MTLVVQHSIQRRPKRIKKNMAEEDTPTLITEKIVIKPPGCP
jgi:hypothetical protein